MYHCEYRFIEFTCIKFMICFENIDIYKRRVYIKI